MKKKLTNILYSFSLIFFLIAFNIRDNPPSGWYQQFMPLPQGAQIVDMIFIDSLTGFITTTGDTSNLPKIYKTTDGGDNWIQNYEIGRQLFNIQSISDSIIFVSGARVLIKSTNKGINWDTIGTPDGTGEWMSVLNEDTIWVVASNALVGGVFRTTNGGASWQQQASFGNQNPQKIYMLNANIGFISTGASNNGLRRTTDGGATWTEIPGVGGFTDLKFIDENTGWKALTETSRIRKTTNGGVNWFDQWLPPQTNFIFSSRIRELSIINKDTIWGSNPRAVIPDYGIRGLLYISTNGGDTWGYQLPDPEFNIPIFLNIDFIDKYKGWSYHPSTGVHTVTGGDTTFFTSIEQISNFVPEEFQLYQNYPNPFNPATKIRFDVSRSKEVRLIIYDILGKEVRLLVNEKLSAGSYEYIFDAGTLPSGVYFYSLVIGKAVITKKMLLTK